MTTPLSLANIEDAAHVIAPEFLCTPQYVDPALSGALGRDLVVKVETLNPLRSFKGRGAEYFVRGLDVGRHVVCASAGNFGQAIAYAARRRDIPITVFSARNANPVKVARMREFGAEVVLDGEDFDVAKSRAIEHAAARSDRIFVEDGRDPAISEGAGTIGVELAPLGLDVLLVPVGNGGLINGVGRWLKAHSPSTRIVGVCAAGAPAMERSWRAGRVIVSDSIATIADGIAGRVPVPVALEWMRDTVDDMVAVDDDQILAALRLVRDTVGQLLEPSAVVGVAAAMQHDYAGRLATIVTGSNYSPDLLAQLTGAMPLPTSVDS
ncbi:MAG TPA: pyridoxal-phosphate dependent enzyme [Jatrophihabitantaceae bacterium]|jgi:threonine dehydratase